MLPGMLKSVLVGLFVVGWVGAASAENRSWTVAKSVVSDKAAIVGSINITAVQQTGLYKSFVPMLLATQGKAGKAFDEIKATCGFDPTTSITDISVSLDEHQQGLIFVGLSPGVDQTRALDCLQKIASTQTPPRGKITAKKRGRITEYSVAGDKKKLYAAWFGNVVAISTDPNDKTLIDKLLRGKGAKGTLGGLIGRAKQSATAWFVAVKGLDMPPSVKGTPRGAVVMVDVLGTSYSVDAQMVMATPEDAKALADASAADLAKAKGQMPPDMARIFGSIKIANAGDATTLKLTVAEKDIMSAITGFFGSASGPPPPPPSTRKDPLPPPPPPAPRPTK